MSRSEQESLATLARHEDAFVQLESELGATVQRLELHREGQLREVDRLSRDLVTVAEEREECRARAQLAEHRAEAVRQELDEQVAAWLDERRQLERRVAEAEASTEAAGESERRIMSHAAALESRIESRIVAAQAERSKHEDVMGINEELSRRAESQSEQIGLLRDKLAEVTAQLSDTARLKLDLESQARRQHDQNASFTANQLDAAKSAARVGELERQARVDKDRLASARESLQSAVRLAHTREQQVDALQEALDAQRDKARRQQAAAEDERDSLRLENQDLLVRVQQLLLDSGGPEAPEALLPETAAHPRACSDDDASADERDRGRAARRHCEAETETPMPAPTAKFGGRVIDKILRGSPKPTSARLQQQQDAHALTQPPSVPEWESFVVPHASGALDLEEEAVRIPVPGPSLLTLRPAKGKTKRLAKAAKARGTSSPASTFARGGATATNATTATSTKKKKKKPTMKKKLVKKKAPKPDGVTQAPDAAAGDATTLLWRV